MAKRGNTAPGISLPVTWTGTSRLELAASSLLTGADGGYDACPEYLLGTFVAKPDPMILDGNDGPYHNYGSDLTLVPCKQDLRQDRIPTYTKAQFDIWNEDEVKSTGAYMCFKCWLETTLEPRPVSSAGSGTYRNFDKFGIASLHTDMGFFRVTGVASTACKAADWYRNFRDPTRRLLPR